MSSIPELDRLVLASAALRCADLETCSLEWVREQLLALLAGYKPYAIGLLDDKVYYRAVRCDTESGFSTLQRTLYPPEGNPNLGRANLPRDPVLYASGNRMTAVDEIDAAAGDYVQIVWLRLAAGLGLPCHVVGEYQSINNSGRSLINATKMVQSVNRRFHEDPASHIATVYVDSFLAESFRRRVGPSRNYEYKTSATFAGMLYKAGGLMYPSIRTPSGINIAIPARLFDAKFEVIFTELYKIERSYGYGLYNKTQLKKSCDFSPGGVINWNSCKRLPMRWDFLQGSRSTEPFVGWRKPE